MEDSASAFLSAYQASLEQALRLPPEIADAYELCDCLQESGSKSTYLISSKSDGKPYILKVASKTCKEDLAEEYSLLRSLRIPMIPRAVCFQQDAERRYLIRAYVKGATLLQCVEKDGPFREDTAVSLLNSLCETIRFLHAQTPPVIHRDIKPQNVVLTPERACALIDFGTARRFQPTARKDTIYLGTLDTAAPEQFGYKQTDIRSDIYSMGMLLLFLCTGSYDLNDISLIKNRALARIITRCTRFDPDRRYKNIQRLQATLRRVSSAPVHPAKPLFLGIAIGLAAGFALAIALPDSKGIPFLSAAAEQDAVVKERPMLAVGEQTIEFDSPAVEQAVRAQLGVDAETPLRQSDLDHVTSLFLFGQEQLDGWGDVMMHARYRAGNPKGTVETLSDIPKLRNLTDLSISNQSVADLSPLSGMQIVRLALGGNLITDLSPLTELPYLKELCIESNPIVDIQPLRECVYLRVLVLDGTSVVDFSPLSQSGITHLYVNSPLVDDYSFLADLPSLEELSLSNIRAKDIELVSRLTNLTMLEYHGDLSDLTPVLGLTNLNDLYLLDTRISSLDGIQALEELDYLCLSSSEVIDLSPLIDLPLLNTLFINMLQIEDLSVLFQLSNLTLVYCSAEQKAAIEASGMPFTFELRVL